MGASSNVVFLTVLLFQVEKWTWNSVLCWSGRRGVNIEMDGCDEDKWDESVVVMPVTVGICGKGQTFFYGAAWKGNYSNFKQGVGVD